jgi:hypothetical protein
MLRPVQYAVRQGLRFRRRLEQAKRLIQPCDFDWYPYDSFANLFYLQHLLVEAALSLDVVTGTDPVLDVGAGDGALSFFLESLGRRVHAIDYSGTNINQMRCLRALAAALHSHVQIQDVDIDGRLAFNEQYGFVLFLGTLYHQEPVLCPGIPGEARTILLLEHKGGTAERRQIDSAGWNSQSLTCWTAQNATRMQPTTGYFPRPASLYWQSGRAGISALRPLRAVEPKAGRHFTFPTPDRSAFQFAQVAFTLAMQYPEAKTIHLVMDNLNIHCRKSLTDLYGATVGAEIWDCFTVHHGPVLDGRPVSQQRRPRQSGQLESVRIYLRRSGQF